MSNSVSIHNVKTISATARDFDFGTVLSISLDQSTSQGQFTSEVSIFGLSKIQVEKIASAMNDVTSWCGEPTSTFGSLAEAMEEINIAE